jgi:hypothetical protein
MSRAGKSIDFVKKNGNQSILIVTLFFPDRPFVLGG